MISAPSTPEAQGEELEGGETDTEFDPPHCHWGMGYGIFHSLKK